MGHHIESHACICSVRYLAFENFLKATCNCLNVNCKRFTFNVNCHTLKVENKVRREIGFHTGRENCLAKIDMDDEYLLLGCLEIKI